MSAQILPFTSNHPDCRKTLAKLRWVYRDMKRENKLALHGYKVTDAASTDVTKTWRRYDWKPVRRRA